MQIPSQRRPRKSNSFSRKTIAITTSKPRSISAIPDVNPEAIHGRLRATKAFRFRPQEKSGGILPPGPYLPGRNNAVQLKTSAHSVPNRCLVPGLSLVQMPSLHWNARTGDVRAMTRNTALRYRNPIAEEKSRTL